MYVELLCENGIESDVCEMVKLTQILNGNDDDAYDDDYSMVNDDDYDHSTMNGDVFLMDANGNVNGWGDDDGHVLFFLEMMLLNLNCYWPTLWRVGD